MPSYFGENEDGDSRGDSLAQTITSTIVDGLVHTVAHWKVLLLGQAVSIVLAIAGGTNEVLSLECKVSTPSTYNAFGYCVVGIFGGVLLKWEERKKLKQCEYDAELRHIHDGSAKSTETHEGNEDENDGEEDVNDDLTLEDDDSPSKRTFFSLSRRSRNTEKSNNGSCSDKTKKGRKKQLQYPFLFGLFTIQAKWWYYFTVAFIEAQAYYFIFLAFRYTTFTFVYVSDALAIPAAMLFTKLIMKRSYLWTHLIGGAVCMTGIIVNTVSDINNSHADGHELSADHIKGDILAILGAILLGLDDVLSEIIVSDYGGVTEMVFMKGFFGTLISIVQLVAFEMDSVQALFGDNGRSPCHLSWRMILFSTHVVTRALDVAGEMQFLFVSEATLLNLSLLTSDLYAAIFDVLTTGLQLTIHFYIAFFLIFAGIVLYEAGPSPANIHQGATPLDIQIRKRKSMGYETNNLSASETEHTSNLGVLKQIELT